MKVCIQFFDMLQAAIYDWNLLAVINVSDLCFDMTCSLWSMYLFKELFNSCTLVIILVKELYLILMKIPLFIRTQAKTAKEHNLDLMVEAWICTVCFALGRFMFAISTFK